MVIRNQMRYAVLTDTLSCVGFHRAARAKNMCVYPTLCNTHICTRFYIIMCVYSRLNDFILITTSVVAQVILASSINIHPRRTLGPSKCHPFFLLYNSTTNIQQNHLSVGLWALCMLLTFTLQTHFQSYVCQQLSTPFHLLQWGGFMRSQYRQALCCCRFLFSFFVSLPGFKCFLGLFSSLNDFCNACICVKYSYQFWLIGRACIHHCSGWFWKST